MLLAGVLAACAPPGRAWVWSGALESGAATVRARLEPGAGSAAITVARDADFGDVVAVAKMQIDAAHGVAGARLTGLAPSTEYHYRVTVDGRVDVGRIGRFRTAPSGPSNFEIAFGSCAQTGAESSVFDRIRERAPLFFLHLGDLHYENIDADDDAIFGRAFDRVMASKTQSAMFRAVPIVYVWDDHDFGPNASSASSASRPAARRVFEATVPHHPLASPPGAPQTRAIYRVFDIGRVRFVITDTRSERTDLGGRCPGRSEDSMLGAAQRTWLLETLKAARAAFPIVVWANPDPWIARKGSLEWGCFPDERRRIAKFVADEGIANIAMISGDAHMLAIDDGTHNTYGGGPGFPVMHAAPLSARPSRKGGPYVMGPRTESEQFGVMAVRDDGGDRVELRWSGHDETGAEVMAMRFTSTRRDGRWVLARADAKNP